MKSHSADDLEQIADDLLRWLSKSSWTLEELLSWLQGHELPPVGYDEEPYVWIVRAIAAHEDGRSMEFKLAGRIASALTGPELLRDPRQLGEKSIWNMLMTCACIADPDVLLEPLHRLFMDGTLKGKWLGRSLKSALEAALATNQCDSRMQEDWRILLAGRRHPQLPGSPMAGFEGVLLMPESFDRRGTPYLDEIGLALGQMATILAPERDRNARFRLLLSEVQQAYPGRHSWPVDLVLQADRVRWPTWAVDCLELFVELERKGNKRVFLLQDALVEVLKQGFNHTVESSLCREQVFRVSMPQTSAVLMEDMAPILEYRRQANIYNSSGARGGVILDALAEGELVVRVRDSWAASRVQVARKKILADYGFATV